MAKKESQHQMHPANYELEINKIANTKQKRDNDEPHTLWDPPTDTQVLSFEQFTNVLTKHAQIGGSLFCTCVLARS